MNMNIGPNMTILCSVIHKGEVVYETWHRSEAELFGMDKGIHTNYSYTSKLPSPTISYIANEQASRDYQRVLQRELEMKQGKTFQSLSKMDKNVRPLIIKSRTR